MTGAAASTELFGQWRTSTARSKCTSGVATRRECRPTEIISKTAKSPDYDLWRSPQTRSTFSLLWPAGHVSSLRQFTFPRWWCSTQENGVNFLRLWAIRKSISPSSTPFRGRADFDAHEPRSSWIYHVQYRHAARLFQAMIPLTAVKRVVKLG